MKTELEEVLSNFYKEEMIEYLQSNPEKYSEAIALALSNKQPYSWRSAWLLWSCLEKGDQLLTEKQMEIIEAIPTKKDGHQRELLKLLSLAKLEEDSLGYLFDVCLEIWKQIHKSPSARFTAFRMMINISEQYPELLNEIACYTNEHWVDTLSPGIKNAIQRMIRENLPNNLLIK